MAKIFRSVCLRIDSGTSSRYRIKCGFILELLYNHTIACPHSQLFHELPHVVCSHYAVHPYSYSTSVTFSNTELVFNAIPLCWNILYLIYPKLWGVLMAFLVSLKSPLGIICCFHLLHNRYIHDVRLMLNVHYFLCAFFYAVSLQ